MKNEALSQAKSAKKDEFYTDYDVIAAEVGAYLDYDPDTFRGKTVLCNCDDPYESNFFQYFALNFKRLGLKRLITTCYAGSPVQGTLFPLDWDNPKPKRVAHKLILTEVTDCNGDGKTDIADVEWLIRNDKNVLTKLRNGSFDSKECVALLEEADIVVTNPPFSRFRDFVALLMKHNKKFLIIGNLNAVTYKEIFPLFKDNRVWYGPSISSGDRKFYVPDDYELRAAGCGVDDKGRRYIRVKGVRWFTNLDHGRRHQPLKLMPMAANLKFSRHKEVRGKAAYARYDNYDAIEVPYTDAIPADYTGVMGVPVTFLDKYCPEQFEIIDAREVALYDKQKGKNTYLIKDADGTIGGKPTYARICIRKKQ